MPPHPLSAVPQTLTPRSALSCSHVFGVQPQTFGLPPPPHVLVLPPHFSGPQFSWPPQPSLAMPQLKPCWLQDLASHASTSPPASTVASMSPPSSPASTSPPSSSGTTTSPPSSSGSMPDSLSSYPLSLPPSDLPPPPSSPQAPN